MRACWLVVFVLVALFSEACRAAPGCEAPRFDDLGSAPNNQVVASQFLPYAIASAAVYRDGADKPLDLRRYDQDWSLVTGDVGLKTPEPNGFALAVFARELDHRVEILVAFRGTENAADWIWGNASWVTQIGGMDQYGSARRAFAKIIAWADRKYAGRSIYYTATGHSLGGGLARHVAVGFPCVRVVAFDSSCVVNAFRFPHPQPRAQIVLIYEDQDPITWLCNRILKVRRDGDTQIYGSSNLILRSTKGFAVQHSIDRFALGQARMILCCAQGKRLGVEACSSRVNAAQVTGIRKTYCEIGGRNGKDVACDFTGRTALKDRECVRQAPSSASQAHL